MRSYQMKYISRSLVVVLAVTLLLTLTLGAALSAGTPVVTPGADAAATHLGGVRFRKLASGAGGTEVYLGVPDLGDALRRTEMDLIWGASNTFSFVYDTINDKITIAINNGTTDYNLEYPNFSTSVRDLVYAGDQSAADSALSMLNYMQINVTLGENSPAQISLENVYLDANLLGNFSGVNGGTLSWQVTNYDLSQGFTLIGTFSMSNITSNSAEKNTIEITFGKNDADTIAPVTSNVVTTQNPVAPSGNVIVTAVIDDSTTGNSNIKSAEYQLDGGSWLPMNAQDGTFDSPAENVTSDLTAPAVRGGYSLCVRGTDMEDNTNTGECNTLTVDDQGPLALSVAVLPAKAAGGINVDLTATIDDSTTGGANIKSAEYQIDGGAWMGMSAQDSSFDSATEAATASFLSPSTSGVVNVCVRGTDALDNLGTASCVSLTVDSLGPLVLAVVGSPNPAAAGAQVTISASVVDITTGNTNIQSADFQLDGGAWMPMSAQDGGFDSTGEDVTAQFNAPVQAGTVNMCVRGTDAFGNTGSESCNDLTVSGGSPSSQPVYLPIVVNRSNP
jgi:hypothetical protein